MSEIGNEAQHTQTRAAHFIFAAYLFVFQPSRFARVILKNHPKNDRFGLHKLDFPVFMRAMRRGDGTIHGNRGFGIGPVSV